LGYFDYSFITGNSFLRNRLSSLVEAAINGEEVILLNGDRPVAKILSIELQSPRVLGLHQNKGWIAEDFNTPLPDNFWVGEL
jgi:antitoxin (DNA-binding transcriptional repressor) of toxin-antitoxin stability system